jgi:tetratricopeptide (TPR) repeat protein
MKKIIRYPVIIIFISLFIVSDLYTQSCSWGSYIDIPSANVWDGFFINLNGGYAFSDEAEQNLDVNGSIEYSIAGFTAGLKVYTEKNFCLDLSYQILEENGGLPALSMGVENLTNNKFVSPLGDSGLVDELYYPRPPELASAYIVATKGLSSNFEATFGLGRGKFVGYGPRSKYLNFDAFLDDKHADFVFGVFGGMKFIVPAGVSFILETDGRDANVGLGYEAGIFKTTLGLNKIEHFFTESNSLINAPWINLSLSVNAFGGSGVRGESMGILRIALKDKATGRPIQGKMILSRGNIEKSYEVPAKIKRVLKLDPGVYKITVFSAGYKMKTANIPIKSGAEMDFDIDLTKVINPAIKKSMDLTKAAATDYKYGRFEAAREKLEEAITLYPNNKKAKKGLEMIREAFASNLESLKDKARARESSGDIRGAISIWGQVLELDNSYSTRRHIQNLKDRLSAASRRRQPVRTTTTTTAGRRAPARKPSLTKQQIADLYTKGLSAYFDGNYKEAIKYFQQVLSADPNHAQAKRYLGEAKKH